MNRLDTFRGTVHHVIDRGDPPTPDREAGHPAPEWRVRAVAGERGEEQAEVAVDQHRGCRGGEPRGPVALLHPEQEPGDLCPRR